MRRTLLNSLSLLLCLLPFLSQAQTPNSQHHCGTDAMWLLQQAKDPAALYKQKQADRRILDHQMHRSAARTAGGVLTIPVVVHIIHNGGPENISNATVQQGIADLNAAFANQGVYNSATGIDTEIQFCLASQDPSGQGTTGINRVVSPLTDMIKETQDLDVKNLIRWDPLNYLNIWLVNSVTSNATGPGVAGYAYFPSAHGSNVDGIMCEALYMGSDPNNTKVMIHEVGHYLGLYHTFQGGCTNNNCLTDGDQVCDTPPDASTAMIPCFSTLNTCSTDEDDLSTNNPFRPINNGGLGDQPDMIQNYMDYGQQVCQIKFTLGQKDRMQAALNTTRASLLTSLACLSPCANPITAGFIPSATNVQVGTPITFTNTTTGATLYEWQRDGITFSSTTSPTVTLTPAGTYTITLNASNTDPSCNDSHTATITVTCPENAQFTASASTVNIGNSVTFISTSTGPGTSFEWLMDGVPIGTGTSLSQPFPSAGGYHIQLVQHGTICSDTSTSWYVNVGLCQAKTNNLWYFGFRSGLDFNTPGAPTPLNNAYQYFICFESPASIADDQGNLLFYTDGATVWNKNHTTMVNGTNMKGGSSSAQGALPIRKPGSANIYYLFTQAEFAGAIGTGDGLYVSEIDMSLDNGNGAVTLKTDTLMRPATEKMTAVNHCNGRDIWLINHEYGTDAFYAFLVTPNGIQPPVITHVGSVQTGGGNNLTSIGNMKASPDGKKIALSLTYITPFVEIFDFDNNTGILSNPINITQPTSDFPYGVEFSPDGSRLYIATSGEAHSPPGELRQYDMTASSPAALIASQTIIYNQGMNWGDLQLGPDGKIYLARDGQNPANLRLGVINNPNALGTACNFDINGVILTEIGSLGLPTFNQSYFTTLTPELTGPDTVCANSQGITYRQSNLCSSGGTFSFQVAGDAQIIATTDTTVTLSFGNPGTVVLTVTETAPCGQGSSNLTIQVNPSGPTVYLGPDITLCQGASATLDAGPGYSGYLWQNGATTQTIPVSTPGTYWVQVAGGSTCRPRDSVNVSVSSTPLTVNIPNQTICEGGTVTLNPGPGYATYTWQDGSNLQTYTAWLPGTYSVTVTGSTCIGTATDQATVTTSQAVPFSLGPDALICQGDIVTLQTGLTGMTYLWQDGSSSPTLSVTQPGIYWVQVTNPQGCTNRDSIELSPCVSTTDPFAAMQIGIWPNPTSAHLHFVLQATQLPDQARLSLTDITGRSLITMTPTQSADRLSATFDLTDLPAGFYFLRLHTDLGTRSWKVQVE